MTYFKDWFSRDADYGYTYYNPSQRAYSWDRGYTNYSDFFFGHSKKLNMEEAASLLSTMSKVVGIDSSKFTGKTKKSGEHAYIPARMLRDGISTDVFIGAALQNIAKVMHQEVTERTKMHALEHKSNPTAKDLVYKILSEEMVNNRMADETPGYLKFIKKYKDHAYKTRPTPTNDYQHLIELFDRIMRYPEQITEEELTKFAEPIDKIKKILAKAGGIPKDGITCTKVSNKIAQTILDYVKPPETESPDGSDESESDSSDDSGGESGDGKPDADKKPEPKADTTPENKEFNKEMIDSMQESYDEKTDGDSFAEFMKALREADEVSKKGDATKVDHVVVEDNPYSDARYSKILSKLDMSKAGVIGTLLRRKSRDYQFAIKSTRSGRLDTNKLAEAKQHVSTIYERIGEVKTNKLVVSILVDESGSMGGYKMEKAREAAIFLNECIKDVPDVELYIYGHTADWYGDHEFTCSGTGSTQLMIYKEPGKRSQSSLARMDARYENRDGSAIIAAAKRIRSKTQNQGVFIIISDGEPSAVNYRGEAAKNHTRRMANVVEKMGFQVIQVTIGGYHSKDMFKNVIEMNDMSTFPQEFTAFLRTKINTLIKEKVTM